MSEEHKFIFPDTNIFLHFQFFMEIDWNEVLKAKSVTLIIPPIVAKELDKHKYNHSSERIKDRATKVTKKFAELLRSKVKIRPKVNIQFERIEPQTEFEAYNLSKDSQDDYLIASILRFQNACGNNAVLITNDISLMVKSHQLNIEFFELPEKYRVKSEENPDKQKIQKLETRIREFENRIPNLKIHSLKDEEFLHCKTLVEIILSDDSIINELELIKEKNPHLPSNPRLINVEGDFFKDLGYAAAIRSRFTEVELPRVCYELLK